MLMKLLPGHWPSSTCGLAVLLLVFALSLSQGVWAAPESTGTMPVTCNVLSAIEGSFPVSLDLGDISPNTSKTSEPQTISVLSNVQWTLNIRADAEDGYLKEWTGMEYTLKGLSSPLEWKLQESAEFQPITVGDTTVLADMPPTGKEGTDVSILFKQQVSYDDEPLQEGSSYRIMVTYTALPTY